MPVIYVFSQTDDPDALCLLPDDHGGAVLGVEHLISLGRKRIAHITGPASFAAVVLRHQGYADALAKAGLPEIDGYYRNGEWSEVWGPGSGGRAVRRQGGGTRRAVLRQ
jgi:LacI family transcriptional regulator